MQTFYSASEAWQAIKDKPADELRIMLAEGINGKYQVSDMAAWTLDELQSMILEFAGGVR